MQEKHQFTIVGKFSYGKPYIDILRKSIPNQCGIKGQCNIGGLDERHVWIRLEALEDFIQLLSSAAFYTSASGRYWQMRTLKWDPWFELEVEITIAIVWISHPKLPLNFFANDPILSISSGVRNPLSVDLATKNKHDLVVLE